ERCCGLAVILIVLFQILVGINDDALEPADAIHLFNLRGGWSRLELTGACGLQPQLLIHLPDQRRFVHRPLPGITGFTPRIGDDHRNPGQGDGDDEDDGRQPPQPPHHPTQPREGEEGYTGELDDVVDTAPVPDVLRVGALLVRDEQDLITPEDFPEHLVRRGSRRSFRPVLSGFPLVHTAKGSPFMANTGIWGMMGWVRTTTKTIERPDVREDNATSDDTPKFFHYVKKDQIVDSAVNGRMVVALCGETFPVTKQA